MKAFLLSFGNKFVEGVVSKFDIDEFVFVIAANEKEALSLFPSAVSATELTQGGAREIELWCNKDHL